MWNALKKYWYFVARKSNRAEQLSCDVHAFIAAQHRQLEQMQFEIWKWGPAAGQVGKALKRCEAIVLPALPSNESKDQAISVYLQNALSALEVVAQQFREDHSDEDGYGLGTVREFEEQWKRWREDLL